MYTERWYLAGPMSGIPAFNIPFLDETAAFLRERAKPGVEFVSPAELDDPKIREACLASEDGEVNEATGGGNSWGDFLARDVKLIADGVTGIILLPGWEKSRGARLEAFVGLLCNKKFALLSYFDVGSFEDPDAPVRRHPAGATMTNADYVREVLEENMP